MPNQRRSRPVRRSSGSGDVFIPVIIILLGITILSLLIAFVWQKWQDKYDPDYLYPDSRPSSSQSESSSEASEPSSSEESSSEPGSSAVQFGQPVPESERVTSAYFNDAVFIGDSLTTGIQLYNIYPGGHRHRGQQADHSGSRRRPAACQDLCDAGYQRSEGTGGGQDCGTLP